MKTGTIVQISGPVVDVEFAPGHLPRIREALSVKLEGKEHIMEVAQHVGDNTVRCVMLSGSDGLVSAVCRLLAPGKTDSGSRWASRHLDGMFNVLGQPIDGGEPVPEDAPA